MAIVFAVLFAPFLAWLLMLAGGGLSDCRAFGGSNTNSDARRPARGFGLLADFGNRLCSLRAAYGDMAVLVGRNGRSGVGGDHILSHGVVEFFDMISPSFEKLENASVSMNFGSPQWLTITNTLPLSGFPAWNLLPVAMALAAITVLAGAADGLFHEES